MPWWIAAVVLAAIAGFMLGQWWSVRARGVTKPARDETTAIENLQAVNALLRTLASAPDITRSLFELALRIRAIVPCDRVGLALLSEDGEGYNTYTARLDETSGEVPRAQLHFQRRSTVIDEVVKTGRGRIIDDVSRLAPEFLDANVVRSAGFLSVVMLPLMFEGRAIGTLNLVARRARAFSEDDLHALEPVAEALAVSHGNRRVAHALARHQTANELSELTFAFANDMSGAVQVIIGQCELLAHQLKDPAIEAELGGMLQQAKRLREILNNMQRMTREHVATASRPQ
jgi:transcriptional regulator with GAF, ATPase, and Fis domain